MRIIEYTITNPSLPGFGEKHRLITSLLNAELYPAKELIVLYHERWEIELEFDEINLLSAHRDYDIRTCLRSRLVMRDDIFSI